MKKKLNLNGFKKNIIDKFKANSIKGGIKPNSSHLASLDTPLTNTKFITWGEVDIRSGASPVTTISNNTSTFYFK